MDAIGRVPHFIECEGSLNPERKLDESTSGRSKTGKMMLPDRIGKQRIND
jgi:hypothetical protein